MKIVKIEGKKFKISGPQVRSLKKLKQAGFVASRSEFWEGPPSHLTFELGINKLHGVEEIYRIRSWNQLRSVSESKESKLKISEPKRVSQFFAANPRCNSVIVGSPRRINSILNQTELLSIAKAESKR